MPLKLGADAGHIGMNIFFFQKRQKFAGAVIENFHFVRCHIVVFFAFNVGCVGT